MDNLSRPLQISVSCLTIITLILVLAVMKILASLFVCVFISILLSLMLYPSVLAMVERGVPRGLTIAVFITVTFLALTICVGVLIRNLRGFLLDLNNLLPKFVSSVEHFAHKFFLFSHLSSFVSVGDILNQGLRWISTNVLRLANSGISFLVSSLSVALLTAFLLLEMQNFHYRFSTTYPTEILQRFSRVTHEISTSVRRYLVTKTFISFLTGLTIYVCILFSGASYALIWGILGFFFNFIPVIGSSVIVVLTMFVGIAQLSAKPLAMWFILISMPTIQLIYGQILEPKLQGNNLNLSPFMIVVSIFFWGWMWGIIGVFLSVPMMVLLRVIIANFGPYKAISYLMEAAAPPKNWKNES